jgi:hypothetical protein
VGVAGYRVVRDDAVIATTPSLGYADRNLAAASSHSYRVQAVDAAGNASAATALRWVTVPVPPPAPTPATGAPNRDVSAPAVSVLSPRNRARLRRRAVIKARARDNAAVARIDLYIDGRRVTTVRGAALKRTWRLRGVRPGAHSLRIRAFDGSGNHASRSVRVRVLRRP